MQSSWGRLFIPLCIVLSMLGAVRCQAQAQQPPKTIPSVDAAALDGHRVSLPHDLSAATVVIVGFSKASADATTAWEIPVRKRLASESISFYDVAVLASVPGFLHGWVTRAIRGKVPPVLQPRFLPVFADEAAWKQACAYDSKAPNAAYVLLVDRSSKVLWHTHETFNSTRFDELAAGVNRVSGQVSH